MHIRGLKDLEKDCAESGEVMSCELLVPVAFQEREALTIGQKIANFLGTGLPIVKRSEVTAWERKRVDRARHQDSCALSNSAVCPLCMGV